MFVSRVRVSFCGAKNRNLKQLPPITSQWDGERIFTIYRDLSYHFLLKNPHTPNKEYKFSFKHSPHIPHSRIKKEIMTKSNFHQLLLVIPCTLPTLVAKHTISSTVDRWIQWYLSVNNAQNGSSSTSVFSGLKMRGCLWENC